MFQYKTLFKNTIKYPKTQIQEWKKQSLTNIERKQQKQKTKIKNHKPQLMRN